MEEALAHCLKQLGDNVTILYDYYLPSSIKKLVKEQGKEAGGLWDYYRAIDYFGWETERVVVVTIGVAIMELITRARTHLNVVLVGGRDVSYQNTKNYFQRAADQGLVEIGGSLKI